MECSMDQHDLDNWLSILSLFFEFYFDHGRKSPYSTCVCVCVCGDTPLDSYAGYFKWVIRPVACFILSFSDFSVNKYTHNLTTAQLTHLAPAHVQYNITYKGTWLFITTQNCYVLNTNHVLNSNNF